MNRPTDSVRIVVLDQDQTDTFLVLTEADDLGNWKLPGGKFDTIDEAPDHAARRELQEELGLGSATLTRSIKLLNEDGISARYIYAALVNKKDVAPSTEIAEVAWVDELTIPRSKNSSHILSAYKAVVGN